MSSEESNALTQNFGFPSFLDNFNIWDLDSHDCLEVEQNKTYRVCPRVILKIGTMPPVLVQISDVLHSGNKLRNFEVWALQDLVSLYLFIHKPEDIKIYYLYSLLIETFQIGSPGTLSNSFYQIFNFLWTLILLQFLVKVTTLSLPHLTELLFNWSRAGHLLCAVTWLWPAICCILTSIAAGCMCCRLSR